MRKRDYLLELKKILDEHGYDITPDQYEEIVTDVPKPCRATLRAQFGTWQAAVHRAKIYKGGDKKESYSEDYKADSGVLESKSYRVTSLDSALKHFKVDTKLWEVDRYVINKWEIGAKDANKELHIKPLIQVKVWIKRKEGNIAEAINTLIKDLTKKAPVYPTIKLKKFNKERFMYEIALADLHYAMYAWKEEVGSNYDIDIADEIYKNAVDDLLMKAQGFPIELIALPTGNDFFHSDNLFNTSTKGTALDIDSRWQKAFTRGHRLLISVIDRLSTIAPVCVPMVPGNHDVERLFYLGEVLNAYYSKTKHVDIMKLFQIVHLFFQEVMKKMMIFIILILLIIKMILHYQILKNIIVLMINVLPIKNPN